MKRMPVVFIAHGSPMNAIEDNKYTRNWGEIARNIPKPKAILVVSAHWYTNGTKVMSNANPKMIYDMYGFPKELYEVIYDSQGAPEVAKIAKNLITDFVSLDDEIDVELDVELDNEAGYDHGAWSVLLKMYPEKDIPVFELSIDGGAPPQEHFKIGKKLRALRDQGVLILGSGNVVHNLGRIDWEMDGGFEWAEEFDSYIKSKVLGKKFADVVDFTKAGSSHKLAVPTPEHFYPLLYVLGASDESDQITVYNDDFTMGSLSMTCYLFK
ncbi:MAG: 4,5-DOPA dioxygenase extradiol [Eubacteriales bacterium]